MAKSIVDECLQGQTRQIPSRDFIRFHGSGRVNQVQELNTLSGKPFVRLWLGLGGNAAKSDGVVQIDFWDQQEWPRLLRLQRGQRVLALGRMSGKINTNGFWNAAVYGDALYLDHADDGFKAKD